MSSNLPKSILMILGERARQVVEEGYDAPHDMEHEPDHLAMAAATYALPAPARARPWDPATSEPGEADPVTWPWEGGFKPTPDDRLRELVKAGALIVAEIDRVIMEERMRFEARRKELLDAGARGETITAQDYVTYFPELASGPGGNDA